MTIRCYIAFHISFCTYVSNVLGKLFACKQFLTINFSLQIKINRRHDDIAKAYILELGMVMNTNKVQRMEICYFF